MARRAKAEAAAVEPAASSWRVWGVDFDARIAQLVVVSLTVLILAFNNRVIDHAYDRFVLEFLVPMAIILVVWREDPRRYGLTLGDWRRGLPITLAGIVVMAVVIWIVVQQPDFKRYYTVSLAGRPTWRLVVDTGVDILAWEFFCRGWLLWGLGRRYGADAIWLQVIPFTLMHVYKPQLEQFSTILGGAFFGILAWRTGSMIWGWLLHWFMMAWVLLLVAGQV
jgi:membrane protease YdiL (CAAX protease family)